MLLNITEAIHYKPTATLLYLVQSSHVFYKTRKKTTVSLPKIIYPGESLEEEQTHGTHVPDEEGSDLLLYI